MRSYTASDRARYSRPPAPPKRPRFEANWASLDARPTPEWFLDAKFGVFIHWGVYSVPSWGAPREYAEWYWRRIMSNAPKDALWRDFHAKNYGTNFDYMDFAPKFTAELFDARQWADLFARSGVKYVVPTSKHHDGFALWPSTEASRHWGRPWNALETGPRRGRHSPSPDGATPLGDRQLAQGQRRGHLWHPHRRSCSPMDHGKTPAAGLW